MPFLIDGHNLIAHLPDIDLADEHDEAQLVIKLKGFAARTRKKCIVVFDQGLPGGTSSLSNHSILVLFAASQRTTADAILMERIRELADAVNWTVVSSDNQVLEAGRLAGAKTMRCSVFANLLNQPKIAVDKGLQDNPLVSEAEIAELLQLFNVNENDELAEAPVAPSVNPKIKAETPAPTKRDSKPKTKPKSELDEWLSLFGAEDEIGTARSNSRPEIAPRQRLHQTAPKPKTKTSPQPPSPQAKHTPPPAAATDNVDEWLQVFGEEPALQPTDKAKRPPVKPAQARPQAADLNVNPAMSEAEDVYLTKNTVDAWLQVFGESDAKRSPTDPAPQRSDPSKQGRYGTGDKREPVVHKRMATSEDIYMNKGEVDVWMDFFGVKEEDDEE